jgi:5-oxopent-3-ene-1,2,5-tricarboxylate decarboxylase/2-hydroxyhepta-2,4-diene-1,7-dioate isomerase
VRVTTAGPGAPTKIVAVHANYSSRVEQLGRPLPPTPDYFLKPLSSLAGDGDPIACPPGCRYLCAEGELALVIGRRTRSVAPDEALRHVHGVAAANDLGALDFLGADRGSLLRVKGHDGFCPVGPVVALEEVDLAALRIRTLVNGEPRQDEATSGLLFDPAYVIADLSRFMTLEPGDLVLTGTPAGVPPLAVGDEVVVELGDVSRVANRVVAGAPQLPVGVQPADSEAARRFAGFPSTGRETALTERSEHATLARSSPPSQANEELRRD